MLKNIYVKIRKLDPVLTTITNIIFILLFVVLVLNMVTVQMEIPNNELLGYQPVYVKTGSMEPAIRESAIILTKQVNSMDDIEVGDIITYTVWDETGRELIITHRIYEILEDGRIVTKGDNNRVTDSYYLTIDNVKAKTVCIWNKTADIVNMAKTTNGKAAIASFALMIVFICIAWNVFIEYLDEKCGIKKVTEDKTLEENKEREDD